MDIKKQVDEYVNSAPGWQKDVLITLRKVIHDEEPEIVEEWKWGVPVYTKNGLVCALGSFKNHAKINFFKGAKVADPDRLFNQGLESKMMRSIDFFEGDRVREKELKELIARAVKVNG